MRYKAGEMTGQFGRWLTKYVREQLPERSYIVYYDHGDPAKYDKVAAVKGFMGQQVNNENRLADVDAMVATDEHDILILVEIEESPLSPKTLLGDIFASLFSTQFNVSVEGEHEYFQPIPHTHLIIAGYHPNPKKRKFYASTVHKKMTEIAGHPFEIDVNNVEWIIECDLRKSLDQLRQRVMEIL